MKKCLLFLIVIFFYLLCFSCKKDQEKNRKNVINLKLAHVLPKDHPVNIALEMAARMLEEKSNGRIKLKIIHSGRFGSERQCLEKLKIGSLDLTKVSMAALEQFVKEAGIFNSPYLFRDEEHKWKVLDGKIGKELLDCALSEGFKGLCYMDAGWRSFYTREGHPIRKVEDLNGLKIRVINAPTMIKAIKCLGANAVNIEWEELYSALQQGSVDGAENNIPSLYTSSQYEVVKYYTLDRHIAVPDVVIISKRVWDSFDKKTKSLFEECFRVASLEQRKLWKKRCKEDLKKMMDKGLEVIELSKEALEGFKKKAESFYNDLDPEMKNLANRIRAIK